MATKTQRYGEYKKIYFPLCALRDNVAKFTIRTLQSTSKLKIYGGDTSD